MDFTFTPEHEELRRTVRRFLENESTEQSVRALMETERGYDGRVWERLQSELSLLGLIIPEKYDGAGLGAVEMAIVLEEMGRVLFCAPYFSTAVLAPAALLEAGEEIARGKLLPAIAAGEAIATLALAEADGRLDAGAIATRAARDGAGWRLDGVKNYVLDGHIADIVLVVARGDDGRVGLFHVEGSAQNLKRELLPTLDLTRKLAKLTFTGAPAAKVSGDNDIGGPIRRVGDLAAAMLAAEQVGGAQRCLEIATEYAKTRLQFGRPIGSFQAIKHKLADMLVETEFARSAAYHAAFAASANDAEFPAAAHLARSYCSESYFHAAAENIQIHGGMGFTWEHPAHLYFKRARADAILFGDPASHRQALAALLGI